MAEYIAIPKLGMSMTEATLVEWKVGEGEQIEKGEVVLTIETEKTQWDIEAAESGLVHILMDEGMIAAVSRVVGMIVESEEELVKLQKEQLGEVYTTEAGATAAAISTPAESPTDVLSDKSGIERSDQRIRISPVARKIAEDNMIDISTVKGTGPQGRIVREDIQRAIDVKGTSGVATAPLKDASAAVAYQGKQVKSIIPFRSMRRTIAEHMHRSLAISAQLTQMGEIDMTELKKLRSTMVTQEEEVKTHITYTDILVFVIARVLKEFPIVNSSLEGDEIKLWEDINMGVAVALEGETGSGLIVPVVKNADKKSLLEINEELKVLVEKARAGKLMPDDVADGTFTITNFGAIGSGYGFGTPIINQPQSAILGTGAVVDRPVVWDGQIVIRPIMTYSFTFDHRVIDGAPAIQFMLRVSEVLEKPELVFP